MRCLQAKALKKSFLLDPRTTSHPSLAHNRPTKNRVRSRVLKRPKLPSSKGETILPKRSLIFLSLMMQSQRQKPQKNQHIPYKAMEGGKLSPHLATLGLILDHLQGNQGMYG